MRKNAPNNASVLQNVLRGACPQNQEPITPRPHGGIGHVAPYFPLDSHSHNPASLNFDSLNARNEFYYQTRDYQGKGANPPYRSSN